MTSFLAGLLALCRVLNNRLVRNLQDRSERGIHAFSPSEVRDALMLGGYPNGDKSKLVGSVFATMKRLGDSAFEVKRMDGKLKILGGTTDADYR